MKGRRITYRCPYCGRKAVFGNHFCGRTGPRDPDEDLKEGYGNGSDMSTEPAGARAWSKTGSMIGSVLILLFIIAFSWQLIGVFSLLLLAVPPGVFIFRLIRNRLRSGETYTYRQLLLLTGGNKTTADNLVRAEMERNPGLPRRGCVERALARLLYDRSR